MAMVLAVHNDLIIQILLAHAHINDKILFIDFL